jgi:uncharacterized protein with von Willebrand factor type A (vWA) domain
MADHDVVFDKLAEALEAEPETFRLSRSIPDADAVEEMQEIEEIRRLAEVLDEPQPSSYAST